MIDQKLNLGKPILGYSDKSTVKLDFDDATFKTVKYWALRTMRWFRLRGFIILKSSKNHYHVVFDRSVTWERNMHIVAWVALESRNQKLQRYLTMQCIKESSTLRASPKIDKPSPRAVCRIGAQSLQIKNFLKYHKLIKRINRSILNRFSPKNYRVQTRAHEVLKLSVNK